MCKTPPAALAGALLLCLAGAAGAAEPMAMGHGSMAPAASPSPPGAGTPADRAFAASNDAMMRGMAVKASGDADRDFVAMMLPHHQGAVDMARVEVRYGKDPELRKLAADIIRAQAIEIAEMQAWQKKHPR